MAVTNSNSIAVGLHTPIIFWRAVIIPFVIYLFGKNWSDSTSVYREVYEATSIGFLSEPEEHQADEVAQQWGVAVVVFWNMLIDPYISIFFHSYGGHQVIIDAV